MNEHEPKTVKEHFDIPLRMSPYGLIRQFQPRPMRPVKIEVPISDFGANREIRRQMLKRIWNNKK